jgi:hypothetical protein
MKLSGGSASVWPGYVAAVASLLLSLLLLAGVLVVAISQLGRVVGSYNRQLLVELIEDERRSEEIDELGKKGQALAVATAQAKVAAAQALEQAQRRARKQEQSLNEHLSLKVSELAAAQSELARLELLTRQAGVARTRSFGLLLARAPRAWMPR